MSRARLLSLLFTLLCAVFAAFLLHHHYRVISAPMPLEIREANMVSSTWLLLRGENPFALQNQPEFSNVYGLGYPLVVYPLAKLFGANLEVHRAVSGFFILASCALFLWVLLRQKIPWQWALLFSLLLYAGLLYSVTPLSRPDSTGLFLFLLAVWLPWLDNWRWRSLLISIGAGILSFYVKTYFIIVFPALSLYLFLFVSKRTGLAYGALFLSLFVFPAFFVHARFDTYFSNVFFVHMNFAMRDPDHLWAQIGMYLRYYSALIVLLLLLLYDRRQHLRQLVWDGFKLDYSRLQQALLGHHALSLPWFLVIFITLLIVLKMGAHPGAWMSYWFQLLSPFFLLAVAQSLYLAQTRVWLGALLLALNLGLACGFYLSDVGSAHANKALWQFMDETLATHDEVLNLSPVPAYALLKQNKKPVDSGSSEYFIWGAPRNGIFARFFPPRNDISQRYAEFIEALKQKLAAQAFSLVLTMPESLLSVSEAELRQHYHPFLIIPVHFPYAQHRGFSESVLLTLWYPQSRPLSPEEKQRMMAKLYATAPDSFDINAALGMQFYADGNKARAYTHLRKAFQVISPARLLEDLQYRQSTSFQRLATLGELYFERGEYHRAQHFLRLAQSLNPHPQVCLLLRLSAQALALPNPPECE
jgi:tetratricopeptide (TPR) repeat protein